MNHARSVHRTGRSGFSLIEVMLAIVVVAIGLYGILELMASNQRYSFMADRRAVATELAAGKLAELQALGYESLVEVLPADDAGSSPTFYPAQPGRFDDPYQAARYTWQARFTRPPTPIDAVNVEVRVFWPPPAASRNSPASTRAASASACSRTCGGPTRTSNASPTSPARSDS